MKVCFNSNCGGASAPRKVAMASLRKGDYFVFADRNGYVMDGAPVYMMVHSLRYGYDHRGSAVAVQVGGEVRLTIRDLEREFDVKVCPVRVNPVELRAKVI